MAPNIHRTYKDLADYAARMHKVNPPSDEGEFSGPFLVLDLNRSLYPQYDLHLELDQALKTELPRLGTKAAELLASHRGIIEVRDRWLHLVRLAEEESRRA